MKKGILLLLLFTYSTLSFSQNPCSSPTIKILSDSLVVGTTVDFRADGCSGLILWYLEKPNKGSKPIETGSLFRYTIPVLAKGSSINIYATCQADTCISLPAEYSGKLAQKPNAIKQALSVQESVKILPPSPTASSFARYGEIPVNYHTGLTNQSIPIYTVNSKDVSLDISLSYHGSGNKVGDVASWVGLGWSLNAGGVITRTVQGTPDEGNGNPFSVGYYARNYLSPTYYPLLHNGEYSTTKQYSIPRPTDYQGSLTACIYVNGQWVSPNPVNQSWSDALNGLIDTEPDLFYFNIGGYSGKFLFDSLRVAHFFPEQDIKVTVNYTPGNSGNSAEYGTFNQFILTIPNGTKYYFGGTHGNAAFFSGVNAVERTSSNPTYAVPTSWYLTKIESADSQSSIMLSYQSERYAYFDLSQEKITSAENGRTPPTAYSKNRFDGVRLSNIYTSENNIQLAFQANTLRQDVGEYIDAEYNPSISEARALDRILIFSGTNGDIVGFKQFVFSYDYFLATQSSIDNQWKPSYDGPTYQSDRKRLKLLSVQELSWDESIQIPPYQFEYNTSIAFPRRLCHSQDHWGYYNGNEFGGPPNNSLLHIANNDGINGIPSNYFSLMWLSNRSTNSNYVGFGALTKITYPTKGYTVFDYGVHQLGVGSIGGLRISAISNYDGNGQLLSKKQFDYLSSGSLYSRPIYYYTASILSTPPVGQNCPAAPTPCFPNPTCPLNFLSSTSLLPLSSTQGNHFGYGQVKVLESNGTATSNGYTIYTYNTNLYDNAMYPNSYDDFGVLRVTNYPANPLREHYLQGTLATEEVVNKNNHTQKKVRYDYVISSKKLVIPAMKAEVYTNPNGSIYRFYNFYGFKTGRSELRNKTTTNCKDDGTDCMESTETYEYGSPTHFQMTRMSQPISDGDSLINTYKYSFDYTLNTSNVPLDAASNGIKNLVLNHLIVPIEELNLLKSNGNLTVMGGGLTQYDATALKPSAKYLLEVTRPFLAESSFVPSSIILTGSQAIFNKDSHYPSQANIAFLYNGFGNVSQIEQPQGSGLVSSFLWGYGSGFPIAAIKNADYTTVLTTLGQATIDNLANSNTLSDASIRASLAPISNISNALATIYTYNPFFGITSITAPNGIINYYDYDKLGRLKIVKDDIQNITDKHTYTYATTVSSCSTPSPPTVSISNTTLCEITLSASGCSGVVTWSNGNVGNSINVSSKTTANYTATCTDGTCISLVSNSVVTPTLPSDWTALEIGSPPVAGCVQESSGIWTIKSSGNTYDVSDNFNYVYKNVSGNAVIVAKINSMSANSQGMRSGIMLRANSSPTADYYQFFFDSGYQVLSLYEQNSSTSTGDNQLGFQATTIPSWIRLKKDGNNISVWYTQNASPAWNNDSDWTLYTNVSSSAFNSGFLMGIHAYNNGYNSNSLINQTEFSNVSINNF